MVGRKTLLRCREAYNQGFQGVEADDEDELPVLRSPGGGFENV